MSEKKKQHPLLRAWAAGVFDAKVTFPRTGMTVRFDSVNEAVMKRFHEVVGVGKLRPHERPDLKMANTIWIFETFTADDTRELLIFLSPFLSSKRVKQAAELIGKIERSDLWRKKNPEKAAALVVEKPRQADS